MICIPLFKGWQNEQEEKIESVTNGYLDDITFCKNEFIELLASKDFQNDRYVKIISKMYSVLDDW